MSKNIRCFDAPASSGVRAASATRCARATAASCLTVPESDSTQTRSPYVDGHNTRVQHPGCAARAQHARIIDAVRPAGHRGHDRGQLAGRVDRPGAHPRSTTSRSPISRESPGRRSASSSTGTNPDADTKFCSSNTADPAVNVSHECILSAFRTVGKYDLSTRIIPGLEGIFAIHTPIQSPAHPRIQAKASTLPGWYTTTIFGPY